MVCIYGPINTSVVFELYFKTHQLQGHSHSQIGWIFSLYLFLVFLVGVQVGPVFDHFGPRVLVGAGSTHIVLGLMLLILSKSKSYPLFLLAFTVSDHDPPAYYQIILTYSLLSGLGGALLNAPAYGALAHCSHTRRGVATGVASAEPCSLPCLNIFWVQMESALPGLAFPANLFVKSRLSVRISDKGQVKAESVRIDFAIFRDLAWLGYRGIFFHGNRPLRIPTIHHLVRDSSRHIYLRQDSPLIFSQRWLCRGPISTRPPS